MRAFREQEYDILVSTSVIEVGIDIPNATVIMIEGADRFGLAQLHQFRGRVGRGNAKSYCILMSDGASETGLTRLHLMEQISNGFELAEKDLEMRGPGEFFGVRQSGLPRLRVAQLGDKDVLLAARDEAMRLLESDPDLDLPQHTELKDRVERFWSRLDLS